MYYLSLLLPVLFGAKVLSESDTRIGNYYRFKRRKWKELKEMVSSQYTSTFDIYRVSYQMLLQISLFIASKSLIIREIGMILILTKTLLLMKSPAKIL